MEVCSVILVMFFYRLSMDTFSGMLHCSTATSDHSYINEFSKSILALRYFHNPQVTIQIINESKSILAQCEVLWRHDTMKATTCELPSGFPRWVMSNSKKNANLAIYGHFVYRSSQHNTKQYKSNAFFHKSWITKSHFATKACKTRKAGRKAYEYHYTKLPK